MAERVRTDICVIGAGPAGLTVAAGLKAASLDVIVLERGGIRLDRASLCQNDFQSTGHPLGRPTRMRRFGLGGSGRVWAGVAPELEPLDLLPVPGRPGTGWPFDHEHLRPYYGRARERLGIEPGIGRGRVALSSGIDAVDVPMSRERWRARRSTVRLRAAVLRLSTDPQGERVRTAQVVTPAGSVMEISARAFVLAAGGIENPRLLLASGIGNDNVGRFFSDHCYLTLPVQTDGKPPPGDLVWGPSRARRRILAFNPELRGGLGLPGAAAHFRVPRPAEMGSGIEAWRELRRAVRWGEPVSHLGRHAAGALVGFRSLLSAAAEKGTRPSAGALRITVESRPDRESRVTLAPEKDVFGAPVASVDWRPGRTSEVLDAFLEELRSIPHPWAPTPVDESWRTEMLEPGAHHMGATRMHDDELFGAVDRRGRVHGTENLYVAGSSLFPTYGYANPTLTILALAIRLSDHLGAAYT